MEFLCDIDIKITETCLMKQKPHETHHKIQQNALRYRGIRLCCDVTDVNNTE